MNDKVYTLFLNIDFYIFSLPFYLPAVSSASGYNNNSEIPVFDLTRSTGLSEISGELGLEGNQLSGAELPLFNFSYILAATNNFSDENKLGQGGFGPVYKVRI